MVVTPAAPSTTDACDYTNQAAADAAFATWLASVTATGGCDPQVSTGATAPVAPAFCGGSTTVTWTVTDHCYTTSAQTATFTINPPAAVVVTPAAPSTTDACDYTNQAAADAAFATWLASVTATGGCDPQVSTGATAPVAPAFCGGSTTVTWTVTDHCYTTSAQTATFTINPPAAVVVTPAAPSTTDACDYTNQAAADAAFATWLASVTATGGCDPQVSTGATAPVAPAFCGGSTTVTWTVTDHCYTTSAQTATFTINPPAAVVVTPAAPSTTDACDYTNQAAADAAFATWLASVTATGGCDPQVSTGATAPVAPAFCGGSTTVTWTVTDHCYTTSAQTATFTINPPAAVVVTPAAPSTTDACDYTNQAAADAAFATWLASVTATGGCDPQVSTGAPLEKGSDLTFIGRTTENPLFPVNFQDETQSPGLKLRRLFSETSVI